MKLVEIKDRSVSVESLLSEEEKKGEVIVRLVITSKKLKEKGEMRSYQGIKVDDTDGNSTLTKLKVGEMVSYQNENVEVIKGSRKWNIVKLVSGELRYVKLNNLNNKIEPTETIQTEETVETNI